MHNCARAGKSIRDEAQTAQGKLNKRRLALFVKTQVLPKIVASEWKDFPTWGDFAGPYADSEVEDYWQEVAKEEKNVADELEKKGQQVEVCMDYK